MSRPSANTDKLMIAAAKEIAREQGCTALKIRDVVRRAGVNLGMFHYHFKSKKRFTRVLLQEVYEEFFARLSEASREGPNALTQLRGSLLTMAKFVRDERHLLGALVTDVMNGDTEVLKFVRTNVPRHVSVIRGLLERCAKDGSLPEIQLSQAVGFIMGGLNVPTLVAGVIEKTGARDPWNIKYVLSDAAISQRVEMAIQGIKASRR